MTFVCTGPELFVYVDGKQNGKASTGREYGKIFSDDVSGEYIIGGPDILYNGLLDELKIFNRALSASDIQAEYDRLTKPGASANPGSSNNAAGSAGGNSIILSIGNNKMNINGAQSMIDASGGNVSPVVIGGRTLVPIRAIIVAMGGTISWNAAEQMATLSLNGKEIKLWMNSTRGEVNGSPVTLDVPPRSINGRIFLPLRFVAENFGVTVEWEKATQKITLKY